ncbi:Protein of unknown function [Cognatiyoonia koreensis]|uniref:DUF1353 domain-containing protein n=1 Tax=Cognatiyoonia koreensis TaxID=364200 RepID=A0A1I0S0B4_9RHOB|nr:DUF1353 domain-containing protein [Cognatiyoonia koreensis]SEW47411.1 Protein of unknown function [Cognatiyoonia koreensis]
MQCFVGPIHRENPYPEGRVRITNLTFVDDLILFRPQEELLNRKDDMDVYLLGADKTVHWESDDGDCGIVTVPFGFITDLTSVPWVFRLFVSRAGPWLEAAVVHDYLYVAWNEVEGARPDPKDRKFADDIMFAAMTTANVGAIRKWAIYASVRLFGGWTFGRDDRCNYGDQTDPRLLYLKDVPKVV